MDQTTSAKSINLVYPPVSSPVSSVVGKLAPRPYNKLQETKEPKVSYEADVEDIQDIEGYEHYSYKLGDTVIILDDDYDIDFESRIIQEKQSIKDKTRIITMGYILPSMSDTNSENATVGDNSSSSDKDDVVKDEDFPNTLPDPPILTVCPQHQLHSLL